MKKGKMFYKTFIPILLLGVALAVSFGIYTYIQTVRSVIGSVAEEKQNSITQVKNNLEQKIRTIEYAFNTYSTTRSFDQVVDNPITERDFAAYREVNTQLNYIATMGLDGAEYTLISLKQDWKIAKGTLSQIDDQEKEQLFQQYIQNREKGLFWIKTDQGIRFVNTLPAFSPTKEAIALSDISEATLDRTLRSDSDARVFILNKQGDLMYDTQSNSPLDTAQRSYLTQTTTEGELRGRINWNPTDSGASELIYSRSNYNNWTYFTVLDQKEVAGALKTTRYGLIGMELILILLIAIVSYLIAARFTKPIYQITNSLSGNSSSPHPNEVDWILSSINRLLSEKQSLETLVEAQQPQLETQFVLNLFRSRISAHELEPQLRRIGYEHRSSRSYMTMLVQLDNFGKRNTPDRDVLLLAVNKIAEELIPVHHRMLPVILNDDTQATILMFDDYNEQDIQRQTLEYAKQIIRAVKDYLKLSVSVGISRAYDDLLQSRAACEMSKQALHQRLNLGKESIIFYEDIESMLAGSVLQYPVQLESKLFDAIRLGDEEQVSAALYPLLAEFMKQSRNSMNLEVMLIRLVNNLIQLEQLLGIEVLLTRDHHALYHRLLRIRNPEEVERVLVEQVIFPMVRSVAKKTSEQFSSLSQTIADIVQEEYDRELSLEMIGERLHYNPNYLSSIFKKQFGITFSDYLMSYRLDMAKTWLIETDQTVKEIAERLQYHNPQNFIRSFRKKEQVTPGMYRKLRQPM
ncbi:AraC family transcriptional regulator [Saccharibacillus sp. JS10]|uniref:AraC family transcriptional regulator n=1 Tax=Saccharibacillus sp. JS10 TaxID=2950552 RepID=UPI00210D7C02|nr:helix-turn-helix domain-containing protein [Saccharibacillus sp. JS10]MCQ4085743.1 AraC family transcriptional regulator [Saccharibacillus sp. JS10]